MSAEGQSDLELRTEHLSMSGVEPAVDMPLRTLGTHATAVRARWETGRGPVHLGHVAA